MPPDPAPLILTLLLDEHSQSWFDGLRSRYFPADRLRVGAHVTMFHALPGAREAETVQAVTDICRDIKPVDVSVLGLRFLGRGVAFSLGSPGAMALRGRLRAAFEGGLTAQDAAAWSPHVTIQNKVTPAEARQTRAALAGLAWPTDIQGRGVAIWRYLGGPWEHLRCVTLLPP